VLCHPASVDAQLVHVVDRLMAAGRSFALLPAGQAALDTLEAKGDTFTALAFFVAVETGASVGVGEWAVEHLEPVLSSDEGVDDSIETGSNRGE